jgi:hypothetical protein
MSFTKSFLLASSAALMGVSAVQAADLPSRKAAPVEYVRVCDAYGRGFFYIPGTDTCVRIGGLVRADYGFVASKDVFGQSAAVVQTFNNQGGIVAGANAIPAIDGVTGVRNVISGKNAQHTVGWEARARITFDARTQTSWGVVQTAARLRMARVTGVFSNTDVTAATSTGAGVTLEAAFIRFAGFTFGASRDNFAMMPSLTYGAGHWGSFANGAKQIAYTHSFGGGFSATLALQDLMDTGGGGFQVDGSVDGTARYVYNSVPNIVGRLDLEQGWGSVSVAGAVAQVSAANNANRPVAGQVNYSEKETVWAATIGARFNLPMLARGSKLYLTAAYADGMTEYTTNWTSFKSSAGARDVGGFTMNHPSVVFEQGGVLGNRIETVKSWNLAALLEHYWTPQYRSVLWGSYGSLDAPVTAAARAWNGTSGFGDAKVWNIGTNFAWLPTRDFEIGVEVIYARVDQDVRSGIVAGNGRTVNPGALTKQSASGLSGRLRVERSF